MSVFILADTFPLIRLPGWKIIDQFRKSGLVRANNLSSPFKIITKHFHPAVLLQPVCNYVDIRD